MLKLWQLLCRCRSCGSHCWAFSAGTEVHCTGSCYQDQGQEKNVYCKWIIRQMYDIVLSSYLICLCALLIFFFYIYISWQTAYLDVCDDTNYAWQAKSLSEKAVSANVPAITTGGIYPGVSNGAIISIFTPIT